MNLTVSEGGTGLWPVSEPKGKSQRSTGKGLPLSSQGFGSAPSLRCHRTGGPSRLLARAHPLSSCGPLQCGIRASARKTELTLL